MSTPDMALRESPAFALKFVAHRVSGAVDEALAEEGLQWTHYAILRVAAERAGLPLGVLAERTCTDRTRISEAVFDLEEEDLVGCSSAVDRRKRLVHLTPRGGHRLGAARVSVEQAERSALLPLDPRERARLATLLAKVIPPNRGVFGF